MELCLLILAISLISLIAAIIIFKNALNVKKQIDDQLEPYSKNYKSFEDFFR